MSKSCGLFLLFIICCGSAFGFHSAEEGVFVPDRERVFLPIVIKDLRLTIDHLNAEGFEVYGPKGTRKDLFLKGIPFLEFRKTRDIEGYPTFTDYENTLKSIHEKHPNLTKLFSIGKSLEGRDLWVMKISDKPEVDQVEPEVKYISSMHGDEITGREVLLRFIDKILTDYDSGNKEAQELINNTEIFMMPSMNPDGSMARTRANHNWADLNRDFPDFSTADNQNVAGNREPETRAVMDFQASRKFAMSANFHGGAEVVNYMWDAIPTLHPFDSLLKKLSLDYANRVSYIKNSDEFENGITNGFAWYQVNGGMQDWSYHWYGDLQFTIELSKTKWPPYSEMENFFRANESALLKFLKNVHQGAGFRFRTNEISGTVVIKKKTPEGFVEVASAAFSKSEFYKVLEPGNYLFEITSGKVSPMSFETEVLEDKIYPKGNFKVLTAVSEF